MGIAVDLEAMIASRARCPRPGCRAIIQPRFLCCPDCWQLVPGSIRRDLQSTAVKANPDLLAVAVRAARDALARTVIKCAEHTGKGHARRAAVRASIAARRRR